MKYFEMFTGIAGFSKGIEQAYENVHGTGSGQELRTETYIRGGVSAIRESGQSAIRGNNISANGGGARMPECIGFSEIARVPCGILRYHYPNVRNFGNASGLVPNINKHRDATNVVPDELPDFDFLCGGFPCQSWSIAGKRQGFDDARGTLFYEIARVLSHKRPGHFLLENVKGLLSADGGQAFAEILRILTELGYRVETVVLNSKHFGVPQNRERVFFIGHLGERCSREILSFGNGDGEAVSPGSVELISGTISTKNQSGQCQFDGSSTLVVNDRGTVRETENIAMAVDSNYHKGMDNHAQRSMVAIPVLTPDRPTKRQNGRRMKGEGEARFTLTSQDRHGVMLQGGIKNERYQVENRIRRLTPTECARLQGFEDSWADLGLFQNKKGEWHVREISDTGKYQVFGNAVTVNVIEAIVARMVERGCLETA
jgi:DNA (cytosine-5)-methyltransferase 1